ncbi:MAG: hypothetical protein WC862_02780 [Patescibacteria group bacterium]
MKQELSVMTVTKTQSITNTKLWVATATLLVASALAFAALPMANGNSASQQLGSTSGTSAMVSGKICSETDGGLDISTPGTTEGIVTFRRNNRTRQQFIKRSDSCKSETILYEFYCGESGVAQKVVNCAQDFACYEGACLREPIIKTLILEDGGGSDGPTGESFIYNLSTGSKTAENGDLKFYDGQTKFFKFHTTFVESAGHPSNAGYLYLGSGDLESYACPEFKLEDIDPVPKVYGRYQYFLNPWTNREIVLNGVYCLVNYDNTEIFRFKVTDIEEGKVKIQYQKFADTGVKTYGCRDGFCDDEVEVLCVGCAESDTPFIQRTKELERTAKSCIENYLGIELPATLIHQIFPYRVGEFAICHPDITNPTPEQLEGLLFKCANDGAATSAVNEYGFPGLRRIGESRVTVLEDLRFDLHEDMHVFTNYLLPSHRSWFNEGMSEQLAAPENNGIYAGNRFECGGLTHARRYQPALHKYNYLALQTGEFSMNDYYREAHLQGDLFFTGLEIDYGCSLECAARIWNRLRTTHAGAERITGADIKAAAEIETGRDLTPLFELLEISLE